MCPLESGVVFLSAFWSCRPLSLARHLAALSLPRSPRLRGDRVSIRSARNQRYSEVLRGTQRYSG